MDELGSDKLLAYYNKLDDRPQKIVKMLYEKLDKGEELHKSSATKVYEKNIDLTGSTGYVMPSVDLVNNLKAAENDKRLGEVILLSSIVLHVAPTADMSVDMLREAVDGFEWGDGAGGGHQGVLRRLGPRSSSSVS